MAVVLASTANMSYEDWLEHRKQGIGGSDASVVCGINKYKSPVELWMDKTGQFPPQEAGEAASWGGICPVLSIHSSTGDLYLLMPQTTEASEPPMPCFRCSSHSS